MVNSHASDCMLFAGSLNMMGFFCGHALILQLKLLQLCQPAKTSHRQKSTV